MNLSKIIKVMDDNCHKRKGCGGCLASTPNTYTLKGYTVGKCMLSELRLLEKEMMQTNLSITGPMGKSSGPNPRLTEVKAIPLPNLKGE